jgi:hypothetical protein
LFLKLKQENRTVIDDFDRQQVVARLCKTVFLTVNPAENILGQIGNFTAIYRKYFVAWKDSGIVGLRSFANGTD